MRQSLALLYAALFTCTAQALALLTTTLPKGVQGVPYRAMLSVSGNPQPFAYGAEIVGLPDGLTATYNYSGGFEIAGTPTRWGDYPLLVRATNGIYSIETPVRLSVNRYSNRVDSIATGYSHGCALSDRAVYCWGFNSFGVVPGGEPVAWTPRLVIRPDRGVTAIASGSAFACAVAGGGVYCWGYGAEGQLGNGEYASVTTGPDQAAISEGSNATAIAGGGAHVCAVVDTGVRCWGWNAWGQLGDGTTTDRATPVTPVAAGSGASHLAANDHATCAVVSGGVQCWGNLSPLNSSQPQWVIPAGSGASKVAMGPVSACAIVNGTLRCWGRQWWESGTVASATPVTVSAVGSDLTDVGIYGDTSIIACTTSISTGAKCWGAGPIETPPPTWPAIPSQTTLWGNRPAPFSSMAPCVVAEGRARCPPFGFSQDERQTNAQFPTQIIPAGSDVTQVTAGYTHTCALVNGGVSCWGDNGLYRLGATSPSTSLAPIVAIPQGSGVTQVSAGEDATCAVRNGGVQCWGSAGQGQLGDGRTNGVSATPVQTIVANSGATQVSVGYDHACAVVSGGVRCWGQNDQGQLGVASPSSLSATPVQAIPAGSGVTAVSAGFEHTCAVVAGGVRCWGRNAEGQLGTGNKTRSYVPQQIVPAGSGVTDIATGTYHTCMVLEGVWCWGSNENFRLGLDGVSEALVPTRITWSGSDARVVAAHSHTCWLVPFYGIGCWGGNAHGQRGDGDPTASWTVRDVMVGQTNATSIAASVASTCISANLGVICWGRNYWRNIGDPNSDPLRYRYVEIPDAPLPLNVDATPSPTLYAATTDGVLVLRHLLGLTGDALISGAVGEAAARSDAASISEYLSNLQPALDIDGDGATLAETDAVLVLRYLLGFRGDALIANAISQGAVRNTSALVEAHLATLAP